MVGTLARPREGWARARKALLVIGPCGCLLLVIGLGVAGADTIVLRGGGQVQGKMVPDPENGDRVQVWLLQGRKPLSFQKAQIVEVIPQASPLDGYIARRSKAPQTAQGQYDLGAWCEQNKLMDLARLHYEAALGCDKSFEPAHRKLGHVFHDGYWLTSDELSAVQGLVKYKGRWVSAEEKAKRQKDDEATAAQANWLRQIRLLRRAITSGTADRSREAEAQLMAIRDPDAVAPLLRVFGGDSVPLRILMVQVISMIPGPAATNALVKQVLLEPEADVRAVVGDHLKLREDPAAVPKLIRALSTKDIKVINRAAWMLGNLGAVQAVPKLLSVLLVVESRVIIAPPDQPNESVMFGTLGGPGLPLAPHVTQQGSVAYFTPPVVGPGVVAYGAVAAPFAAVPGGLSVGAPIPQREYARLATFTYQNVEVLAALEKLTGQNFGYDFNAWRAWISRSFNPNPRPVRRVPQP